MLNLLNTLTSLNSVLWSVPWLSGRNNSFRKVALYVCRSLCGGTLFGRSLKRSLHGGDAFFRGKTPKIAEKLQILAIFRVFCGKTRLFANFLGKIRVFSQKKGGASAKKIIIHFFPRRASRDALCVEHVKSVKDAFYVWRSAGRSFEKLRYTFK